jgi:gluconate 2-dehydrogenase gamma chain
VGRTKGGDLVSPTEQVDGLGQLFLFYEEAGVLGALVARIVPGDERDPGAREAGVVTYIDRALAGPYADWQLAYREGLRLLNAHAIEKHGVSFHALSEIDQDTIVASLEANQVPGFGGNGSADFFAMVWAHTIEGLLCDPAYGGNRNGVGWKLIGFPGAQYGYTAEEMQYGADLTTKPLMTLADIGRLAEDRPDLFYSRSASFVPPSQEEIPLMPSEENTLDTVRSQGA